LTEGANTIRVFIALELPDEAKQKLDELILKLRAGLPGGVRWVDPSGIHLTLKFLGDIDPSSVADLLEAMKSMPRATPRERLSLRLSGLGLFPNPEQPRVLWAGLDGDLAALRALQEKTEEAMSGLGFAPDRRPFNPHLTLGRVRAGVAADLRRQAGSAVTGMAMEDGEPWEPEAVHLIQSTLTPQGAVYTKLGSVPI
jgi:2'-5' RNA ligase